MANYSIELPNEMIKALEELTENKDKMMMEMTNAGAEVVYRKVKANMKSSFKTTESLDKGLRISKSYRTMRDNAINTKVFFYGYNEEGTPIALIALAREYGTSRNEHKKPFLRKAFKDKDEITKAMLEIQRKYIKDD